MKYVVRHLGLQPYELIWQQMQQFTDHRNPNTPDEIWLLEHYPVYTLGQAAKPEHLLNPQNIPIVQTDRGGQVTYHGPGQLICYLLINLERLKIGTRQLVMAIEKAIIHLLQDHQIAATTQCGAPGVYINGAKICSIGLRVRRGCTYHGLSLNLDMDLEPFSRINPCGYQGLKITQLQDHLTSLNRVAIEAKIIQYLASQIDSLTTHETLPVRN